MQAFKPIYLIFKCFKAICIGYLPNLNEMDHVPANNNYLNFFNN